MADTLQSNQHEKLIRRIGYSVGLEDPIDRISLLVDLYVQESDINLALWKKLVKEQYGRKISDDFESAKWGGSKTSKKKLGAEDHFADFYSELNLINRKNNQIYPLYGLEILSILNRLYHDTPKYTIALKAVLLLFFLEADGDIFLNCLVGNFEKNEVRNRLNLMFAAKRELYMSAYLSPHSRAKLLPLFRVQSSVKQESIYKPKPVNPEVEIPDDYLSKILPSRKGWAMQLDLVSNEITEAGYRVVNFLKENQIINDSYAAFYAYSESHRALFIDEKQISVPSIERKNFMKNLFLSYIKDGPTVDMDRIPSEAEIYNLLIKIMDLYKQGNKVKGIIRHQLPLQILYPVFYIISALECFDSFDLELFIKEEQKSPTRRLDVTHLRGGEMEGALSLKS